MSNIHFTSDWHWGHIGQERWRNITEQEVFERTYGDYMSLVKKDDTVYFLGDIVWDKKRLITLSEMPGRKILIRGNHDTLSTALYSACFNEIFGIVLYKHKWLSHAPIHPVELRGRINLHGHVHFNTIPDNRYFNCCLENLWKEVNYSLISFDQVKDLTK